MENNQVKHVFVSYVREDKERVDELCSMLESAQINYWRDLKALSPGEQWKQKVSDAIRSGALVFLACFSENSVKKQKSYMNEELRLAIEEFRLLPPEATWMIPVRFDDVEVPKWELEPGRTIHDLNFADLFGENKMNAAVAFITAVSKIMRIAVPENLASLALVKPVAPVELAGGIQGVVEDMILDPQKVIVLDKLILRESRQVLDTMRDAQRFPDHLRGKTNDDHIVHCVEAASDYVKLIEQFCVSLQVAARWGDPKTLIPWISALKAITGEALPSRSGHEALHQLRYIPSLIAIFTAALASVGQERWDTFKVLLVDTIVRPNDGHSSAESLLQAVNPTKVFGGTSNLLPSVVARSVKHEEDARTALAIFREKASGEYRTPVAEWLHTLLRPNFSNQYLDEATYDNAFDRAEIILGLVSQDLANVQAGNDPDRNWLRYSSWYGRSTWRARYGLGSLGEIIEEVNAQGASWPPLQAGLFGGQLDRVTTAIEGYKTDFQRMGRLRF